MRIVYFPLFPSNSFLSITSHEVCSLYTIIARKSRERLVEGNSGNRLFYIGPFLPTKVSVTKAASHTAPMGQTTGVGRDGSLKEYSRMSSASYSAEQKNSSGYCCMLFVQP